MRVAALYDIHGNLPALEAVLHEVRHIGVDRIVVGGDVVSGPMPRETLHTLLNVNIPIHFIKGNSESEVLACRAGRETGNITDPLRLAGLRWSAAQLSPEDEQVIAQWPLTLHMAIDGLGEVLFCHGTPRSEWERFTRLTPETVLLPIFEGVSAQIVVCGHTHMQFDRRVGNIRVVNAGSIGAPYGEPGAYWLLLGQDVEFRHTRYDLDAAAERIRATAYPIAEEFAARTLLKPPSEAEMLAIFAKVGLR
jgi:putative phosphoesterase